MKNIFLVISTILLLTNTSVSSQNLKSPSEFLGYELGTRFTRHYQVLDYLYYVSKASNNLKLEKYGETNEFRPLVVSYVSSEENIQQLEQIRESNLKRTGILKGTSNSEIAIVWLSYNVHGNEASSTEVAMKTIYDLIQTKQEWLKNTVVIIDPCVNPDGRSRYVNWYYETKSSPYNTNPEVTEHQEPWPGGRPNHYLFDLNRDWAWATQIETQQRLKVYNKWMPHIHVDYHEQGYNSPYYFAPAAEPYHEIITDWQLDFQTQIGKNHATYFDAKGWRYFTKEFFDIFYPSYGDSYPTFMGAIGMTYEQAGHGRAGLGIITENGTELTLKDRIAHHTSTGLSTVEMASKNTKNLISEFKNFFDNTKLKYRSYILRGDKSNLKKVTELLSKHDILSYPPEEKTTKVFDYQLNAVKTIKTTLNDLVIPTNQPKGKMVQVLFEQRTKLSTPLTYDITAWSIPYAYGLLGFASETGLLPSKKIVPKKNVPVKIKKNAYAYISTWNEVKDAAFLGNLLEEGLNVRFSFKPFSVEEMQFSRGSILILKDDNKHLLNFDEILIEISSRMRQDLTAVSTGFTSTGPDFGSSNYKLITNKKIAVLSGDGTASLNFGEIWHFFETQLKYPLHILNTKNIKNINFSNYDVLIIPERFSADENELEILSNYASNGGTIVAIGSSLKSFADKEGFNLKTKIDSVNNTKTGKDNLIPYDQREKVRIKDAITGSIFRSTIDDSHPLAFGYSSEYYSLKLSGTSYELLDTGFNVGYFPEKTTNTAGYAGEYALTKVPNSLLFGVERKGKGQIIYMVDNPLFRSFWENGKLFFANAIFLN